MRCHGSLNLVHVTIYGVLDIHAFLRSLNAETSYTGSIVD
jgi:hypothetical protein